MHLKDTNPDELIVRFRAHCRVTFERLRYDANWRASMYELAHAHLANALKKDYADFELAEDVPPQRIFGVDVPAE